MAAKGGRGRGGILGLKGCASCGRLVAQRYFGLLRLTLRLRPGEAHSARGAGEGGEEEVDAEGHPEADEKVGDEESCVKPWSQGGCEDEGGVEGAAFSP